MIKYYVGIDNGVSGSVGVIPTEGAPSWFKMPVRNELSYTKKKKFINRIELSRLAEAFNAVVPMDADVTCRVERPMVNPMRFDATLSAIRALEATLIFLEGRRVPYAYIDSREWQKVMLPEGLKGSEELKKAADGVCRRLFPAVSIVKGGGDSLLMAEYLRRKGL